MSSRCRVYIFPGVISYPGDISAHARKNVKSSVCSETQSINGVNTIRSSLTPLFITLLKGYTCLTNSPWYLCHKSFAFHCTLIILHLSRMCIYNARKKTDKQADRQKLAETPFSIRPLCMHELSIFYMYALLYPAHN